MRAPSGPQDRSCVSTISMARHRIATSARLYSLALRRRFDQTLGPSSGHGVMQPFASLAGTAIAALLLTAGTTVAAPFEISDSYAASTELVAGTYACRSGLDMDSFTYTFDIATTGYTVRGVANPDGALSIDAEGTISFSSGPFGKDETAVMFGRSTLRKSDGNPVIILGYFFSDGETSYDFCARLD